MKEFDASDAVVCSSQSTDVMFAHAEIAVVFQLSGGF